VTVRNHDVEALDLVTVRIGPGYGRLTVAFRVHDDEVNVRVLWAGRCVDGHDLTSIGKALTVAMLHFALTSIVRDTNYFGTLPIVARREMSGARMVTSGRFA
jgi:hypothetical protein